MLCKSMLLLVVDALFAVDFITVFVVVVVIVFAVVVFFCCCCCCCFNITLKCESIYWQNMYIPTYACTFPTLHAIATLACGLKMEVNPKTKAFLTCNYAQ